MVTRPPLLPDRFVQRQPDTSMFAESPVSPGGPGGQYGYGFGRGFGGSSRGQAVPMPMAPAPGTLDSNVVNPMDMENALQRLMLEQQGPTPGPLNSGGGREAALGQLLRMALMGG